MLGDRTAIFLTCSKFDGARSARGVCLAHLGDSNTYVWRIHSVNEDPRAYVAYLPAIFFVAQLVASPASGMEVWKRINVMVCKNRHILTAPEEL